MTIIEKKNHTDPTASVTEFSLTAEEFNELRLAHIKTMALPVGNPIEMVSDTTLTIKAGFKIPNDTRTELIEFATDTNIFITDSGINGIDTGTVATNSIYYLWITANPTSGVKGAVLSLSSTSPTLPSGFTLKACYPVDFITRTVSASPRLVMKRLVSHTEAVFQHQQLLYSGAVSAVATEPTVISLSPFLGTNATAFTALGIDASATNLYASFYPSELGTIAATSVWFIGGAGDGNTSEFAANPSKNFHSARGTGGAIQIHIRAIKYAPLS
jgi:hypothetical protein